MRAHRVAYALANNTWPGEMMVCHSCDNPACCNPAHLWLGTNSENQDDSVNKGRRAHIKGASGENNPRAEIDEKTAREIIRLIACGHTNKVIATMHGISHAAVSCIRLGKTWPHLPRPANNNYFRRYGSLK